MPPDALIHTGTHPTRCHPFEGKHVDETPLETRSRRTCALCHASVIWARIKAPPKSGGRAYVPFPVERCEAGRGDIALELPLFRFPDGEALLAQVVNNGTTYRSHRDHCPGRPPSSPGPTTTTTPAAFSAASFDKKSPTTNPTPSRRPRR
jgi:hypothetical protein